MKLILPALLLTVISGLTYAATAPVNNDAMTKIGIIDMQQLMQQSPEVANINKKLRAEFEPQQQKMLVQQKQLQAEVKQLDRNDPTMSNDQRLAARNKIIADRAALQATAQTLQQSSTLAQNHAMHTLFMQFQTAVSAVAKQDGYTLILEKAAAPFSSPTMDVTKEVLAKMPKE